MAIHRNMDAIVKIKGNSAKARSLISFLKELGKDNEFIVVEEVEPPRKKTLPRTQSAVNPNEETLEAISDVENGRVHEAKNGKDLFSKLRA